MNTFLKKVIISFVICTVIIIFCSYNNFKNIDKDSSLNHIELIALVNKVDNQEIDESRRYYKYGDDFIDRYHAYMMQERYPYVIIITIIWIIVELILLILLYIREYKRNKELINLNYCRNLDGNYSPSLVEYIISGKITDKSLTATILSLINKKILKVDKIVNSDDYKLILQNNKLELSEGEKIVLNLLINIIGNKKEVKLSSIKNYCSNYNNSAIFMMEYNRFIMEERKKVFKEHIYTKASLIVIILIFISLFGIIMALICFEYNLWFLTIILAIILSISIPYILSIRFYTKNGFLKYKQCLGYKKFLEDFSRFKEKELLEVPLWDKYIIYGVVLDCTDTLNQQVLIKFPNMFVDYNITSDFYTTINKDINSLVNHQESKE